jgi:hypothetical protein
MNPPIRRIDRLRVGTEGPRDPDAAGDLPFGGRHPGCPGALRQGLAL